jgi:hypothetical protein
MLFMSELTDLKMDFDAPITQPIEPPLDLNSRVTAALRR